MASSAASVTEVVTCKMSVCHLHFTEKQTDTQQGLFGLFGYLKAPEVERIISW